MQPIVSIAEAADGLGLSRPTALNEATSFWEADPSRGAGDDT